MVYIVLRFCLFYIHIKTKLVWVHKKRFTVKSGGNCLRTLRGLDFHCAFELPEDHFFSVLSFIGCLLKLLYKCSDVWNVAFKSCVTWQNISDAKVWHNVFFLNAKWAFVTRHCGLDHFHQRGSAQTLTAGHAAVTVFIFLFVQSFHQLSFFFAVGPL